MFFTRVIILTISLSLFSSCTVPFFKDQNTGNNSGITDSQKIDSGITDSQKTPSDAANNAVPAIIDTNPINNSVIKTPPPVVINTNTINESEKDECIKNFQSVTDQQNCTDNFFIKKAMASKDGSICAMVSNRSLQDNCKDNVLFQEISTKNDTTLCNQLKNPDTVGNCFAIIGKQIQAQDDKKTEGKITDPCVGITDKEIKSACTEGVIFNEAVRLRDTAMCKTLENQMKQSMCASLIKSILENGNPLK